MGVNMSKDEFAGREKSIIRFPFRRQNTLGAYINGDLGLPETPPMNAPFAINTQHALEQQNELSVILTGEELPPAPTEPKPIKYSDAGIPFYSIAAGGNLNGVIQSAREIAPESDSWDNQHKDLLYSLFGVANVPLLANEMNYVQSPYNPNPLSGFDRQRANLEFSIADYATATNALPFTSGDFVNINGKNFAVILALDSITALGTIDIDVQGKLLFNGVLTNIATRYTNIAATYTVNTGIGIYYINLIANGCFRTFNVKLTPSAGATAKFSLTGLLT